MTIENIFWLLHFMSKHPGDDLSAQYDAEGNPLWRADDEPPQWKKARETEREMLAVSEGLGFVERNTVIPYQDRYRITAAGLEWLTQLEPVFVAILEHEIDEMIAEVLLEQTDQSTAEDLP